MMAQYWLSADWTRWTSAHPYPQVSTHGVRLGHCSSQLLQFAQSNFNLKTSLLHPPSMYVYMSHVNSSCFVEGVLLLLPDSTVSQSQLHTAHQPWRAFQMSRPSAAQYNSCDPPEWHDSPARTGIIQNLKLRLAADKHQQFKIIQVWNITCLKSWWSSRNSFTNGTKSEEWVKRSVSQSMEKGERRPWHKQIGTQSTAPHGHVAHWTAWHGWLCALHGPALRSLLRATSVAIGAFLLRSAESPIILSR